MKKKILLVILIALTLSLVIPTNFVNAKADEFSDTVNEQLNNLDFSSIEKFLKNNETLLNSSFKDYVIKLVNGKFELSFDTVFSYISNLFFSRISNILPSLISILIISLLYKLILNFVSTGESIKKVIYFACLSAIVIVTFAHLKTSLKLTKGCIDKTTKIISAISPILLTLMVTGGANVSASIYKPTVLFFVNFTSYAVLYLVVPIINLIFILTILNYLDPELNFKNMLSFLNSLIKTVLGILFAVFGIFISIQGIASASFDGISLRATKYAISNSIPIIGGYLSGGFDLVVAGSVLIKNAVGIGGLIIVFSILFESLIYLTVLSLVLKLTSGIIGIISDEKLSKFCMETSKSVSLLNVAVIGVGVMFFIMILLMVCTAGAFI